MNQQTSIFAVLKHLGLFALIGLGVVILAGPVIAILSVLLSIGAVVLPFALVGFLVWALVHTAVKGPQGAIDRLQDVQNRGQDMLKNYGGNVKSMLTWPLQAFRGLFTGLLVIAAFVLRSAWTSIWFITEVGIVALVGVLVGGVVGWATAQPTDIEAATLSHAAIGGVLAAVAGVVLTLRERHASRRLAVARYRFDSTV